MQVPKKLIVVGAGYIALEFACIFNNLGSQVDVFIRGDGVLRGFDKEVCTPSGVRGRNWYNVYLCLPIRVVRL